MRQIAKGRALSVSFIILQEIVPRKRLTTTSITRWTLVLLRHTLNTLSLVLGINPPPLRKQL